MHHCMVDGIAVVELGNLLLDREPEAWRESSDGDAWPAAPAPAAGERLARAIADRAADGVAVALAPVRLATSPAGCSALPAVAGRAARTLGHTLLPPAPGSPLNRRGSAAPAPCPRHPARSTTSARSGAVSASPRTTSCWPSAPARCAASPSAAASRRSALKAMVPADVRSSDDDGRQRQPDRVPVHRAAVRRARPRRAPAWRSTRDGTAPRRRRGRGRRRGVPGARPTPAPAAAGLAAGVRPPAAVQPHDLEHARPGGAALPARLPAARPSTPPYRWPAGTPSRSAS